MRVCGGARAERGADACRPEVLALVAGTGCEAGTRQRLANGRSANIGRRRVRDPAAPAPRIQARRKRPLGLPKTSSGSSCSLRRFFPAVGASEATLEPNYYGIDTCELIQVNMLPSAVSCRRAAVLWRMARAEQFGIDSRRLLSGCDRCRTRASGWGAFAPPEAVFLPDLPAAPRAHWRRSGRRSGRRGQPLASSSPTVGHLGAHNNRLFLRTRLPPADAQECVWRAVVARAALYRRCRSEPAI